jgi:hypothetical protein
MRTLLRAFRVFVGCALILAVGLLAGCGGGKKKLSLSGKVTYKGEPVTGGSVTLHPTDGKTKPLTAPLNADGTYSVTPPALGEMKVAISTESVRGQTGDRYPMMKGKDKGSADASKMFKYKEIPTKYANPETSKLSVTIVDGPNVKDFDLTD